MCLMPISSQFDLGISSDYGFLRVNADFGSSLGRRCAHK